MQILIALCVFYSFVSIVIASVTKVETLSVNIDAETLLSNITSQDMNSNNHFILKDKHESLQTCLAWTAEADEYELFPNGTIRIKNSNIALNESHYILKNGTLKFCASILDVNIGHEESVNKIQFLTFIGLGISMASLLIHLIIFAIVPGLKNLPGCNLAALCVSLFCSYMFLCLIGTGEIVKYPDFCIATAFFTHFFLLASMLWMFIMSFDIFMSLLRATGSLRSSSTHFVLKRFVLYCLSTFGVALLSAIASLLADILDNIPKQFKPEYKELCWFSNKTSLTVFFAGPVIALSCLNFILFGLSALTLHCNKMDQKVDDQKSLFKRRYFMYFRLSVIMGTTWTVGVIANAANVDWLWYIFVLLTMLQGFFIFVAFTCSKKVKRFFREKYFNGSSEQNLTPTFKSYVNPIVKDVNKTVKNIK